MLYAEHPFFQHTQKSSRKPELTQTHPGSTSVNNHQDKSQFTLAKWYMNAFLFTYRTSAILITEIYLQRAFS